MAPVRTVHLVGQRGLRFCASKESCDFIVLKSVVHLGENLMTNDIHYKLQAIIS